MDIDNMRVGMNCHLTAMGVSIFTITEINPKNLMPIGIARLGCKTTQFFVRPMAVKPLTIAGHTNN